MPTEADDTVFEATLTPYRSLGRDGFRMMMTLCCLSAVFSSLPFILFGAWPVAGFYGLWARLSVDDDEDYGAQRLMGVAGRQTVPIGDFLAPPQRHDLADSLSAALTKAKRGPDWARAE